MKKAPSKATQDKEHEMRAEYNFANGVRGKHYRAMQAGHTVTTHQPDGTTITKGIEPREGMDKAAFQQAKLFIFSDIKREIELARADESALQSLGIKPGGGNFLAALGLLCYTEFGGKLRFNRKRADGRDISSENFNLFFDYLGPDYREFRASFKSKNEVYNVFRCGFAHEYYVKESCDIAMLATDPGPGIGRYLTGRFYFVVESYYRDLKGAFNRLEVDLHGKGPAPGGYASS